MNCDPETSLFFPGMLFLIVTILLLLTQLVLFLLLGFHDTHVGAGKTMKKSKEMIAQYRCQHDDCLGWDILALDVVVIDKGMFLNLVTVYVFLKIIMKKISSNNIILQTRNKFNSGACKEII